MGLTKAPSSTLPTATPISTRFGLGRRCGTAVDAFRIPKRPTVVITPGLMLILCAQKGVLSTYGPVRAIILYRMPSVVYQAGVRIRKLKSRINRRDREGKSYESARETARKSEKWVYGATWPPARRYLYLCISASHSLGRARTPSEATWPDDEKRRTRERAKDLDSAARRAGPTGLFAGRLFWTRARHPLPN